MTTDAGASPDFRFVNQGPFYLLETGSDAARDHLEAHLPKDALRYMGIPIVEHRHFLPLALAFQREGFTVKEG